MCVKMETCLCGKPIDEGIMWVIYVDLGLACFFLVANIIALDFIEIFITLIFGVGSTVLLFWSVRRLNSRGIAIVFVMRMLMIVINVALTTFRVLKVINDEDEKLSFGELAELVVFVPSFFIELYFCAIIYSFWRECKELHY